MRVLKAILKRHRDSKSSTRSGKTAGVVVSGQLAFAETNDKERRLSLSEIILKDSSVTYKTIRLVAEAEDKAETL